MPSIGGLQFHYHPVLLRSKYNDMIYERIVYLLTFNSILQNDVIISYPKELDGLCVRARCHTLAPVLPFHELSG